jgi:hypothetical protein
VSSDPKLLSDALIVWTGKGVTAIPSRDEARSVERFGEAAPSNFSRSFAGFKEDFYLSTATTRRPNPEEGDRAAEDLRRMHLEIGDEAVEALVRCYVWDWSERRSAARHHQRMRRGRCGARAGRKVAPRRSG